VKAFDVNLWGADRVQHSIEPKAAYTYVPNESQDELPVFDLLDRIERRNDIAYALVNRLIARSTAADGSKVYREFFNLRLSQSYDIDEARNNRSGENQPFSDLRVEMEFRPTKNFSLDLDSRIPVYGDNSFRTLKVGSSVRDDTGNAAKINYTYKDEDFARVASDYIKLQLVTPILKPLYIKFEERYDFRESRELEKVVGLEYRSKCWSVLLTYRDRYREFDDNDKEIMFTFVLAGLGQDKSFNKRFHKDLDNDFDDARGEMLE
jgi:LPS-assembly protein